MNAFVTGTFDPITLGHLSLVKRAAEIFSCVTVLVLVNPEKNCYYDLETRLRFIRLATADLPNVTVDSFSGYGTDYVAAHGGGCFVRGIRDDKDADYERELAAWNSAHGVETVLFPAEEGLHEVSSHAVRQNIINGDYSGLPAAVAKEIPLL